MMMCTTEELNGYEIAEVLGVARGSVIRAKHIGTDIVALLRNVVGGEVKEYTRLFAEAREQATDRMLENARHQGADAVVSMRYSTSMVMAGTSEIMAYGTAVKLRPRQA